MEKKLSVIAVVMLLAGLLVGLAVGYFVAPSLQVTQTQNLQNQIDSLQNQIDNLQNQKSNLQNQVDQKHTQIQILEEQVNGLQALLGPIKKGAWNLIKSFEGSSYHVATDYFYIAETEVRINWTWTRSDPEFGSFSIYLFEEGQDVYTRDFWNLQEDGTTYAHNIIPSYYYLQLVGANLDYWTVEVEAWIPE